MYSSYTDSVHLSFTQSMGSGSPPRLSLSLGGGPAISTIVDTGSTGLAMSRHHADAYIRARGLQPVGEGTITYSSSGDAAKGQFYIFPTFRISGAGDGHATATNVKMLVTDNQGTDFSYMGVGFDRGGLASDNPVYASPNMNAFLNISEIRGAPATSMRRGYVVSRTGITLGLTGQTSGFALMQLTPNAIVPGNVWNRAQMGLTVNGAAAGTGAFLPDTGIKYMILVPESAVARNCTKEHGCRASDGQNIQINLTPGLPANLSSSYGFTTGKEGGAAPPYVNVFPYNPSNALATSPAVNSGQAFFNDLTYLFDYDGGFVGYSGPNIVPVLGLQGNVSPLDGFASTLPTYLLAPTTLSQIGTGTFWDTIDGPGSLTLSGGLVNLMASNTYSGGTIVNGGTLNLGPGASLLAGSALTLNGGTFNLNGNSQTLGSLNGASGVLALGSGALTLDTSTANTLGATITGTGGLALQGTGSLTLTGNNSYTGPTVVAGGTLSVDGSIAGGVIVASAGTLNVGGMVGGDVFNAGTTSLTSGGTVGGNAFNSGLFSLNGTVAGNLTNGGLLSGSGLIAGNLVQTGAVAPGNSIGTLTVSGNFTNAASSTYAVEVGGAGLSDRINVGGTANLQGGGVMVTALPGMAFAPSTTYTLVNAAGGLSGTFASVNELYPFLQSSLSYDANNAYLNLAIGGFATAAATPTQAAVGNVLDANVNNATGDFATVLGAMAFNTFGNTQAQATLQAISGNNYAGFSSSMVQGAQLFMNNVANQTGGGGSPVSNRVALAEACDVACDSTTSPKWGAWGGALGGLGTIGANQPVGTVTYNVGGFAAGLDRSITDSFRMGVTAGYTTGTQWVSGFDGLGRSNTFQVGLYAGFAQDKVYADALIGYAYTWNQMWRNITVPGLQQRTALGQTGANQFYGQIETGYRFDLGTNANAFVTPFARLQAYTGTQNAFTETSAQSLNLSVAQQTTNSLRSVIGAQIGGSMDLGWREKLLMQLRLGWSHEYADTARPVSATLAGAPAMPFTTFGVAPQRDGVVLGLAANTAIAEATSIYLRYEGDISGQDSAHALTAGVRMTW
jgi:autotransporter-associated beta strand protein